MGKRNKYQDVETKNKFLELVRTGNFLGPAAKALGISAQSISNWRKKFPEFDAEVKQAEAWAECNAVNNIILSGCNKDARYLQWFLQRKFPERWGDNKNELAQLRKEIEEVKNALFETVKERIDNSSSTTQKPTN
jgi:hypothetical protein